MVFINGEFKKNEEAAISVYDHGFLYGDGVFEGIRFYNQNAFLLKEHIDRLFNSCKGVALDPGYSHDEIIRHTRETIEKSGLKDGYIRLLVTRGIGKLGINPFTCGAPGLIIIVDKISLYPDEYYKKGISLITASCRRPPLDTFDTRIKSLNYLNNVMAKAEAVSSGCLEAIILNHNGRVAECSADNIFAVKDDRLLTPAVTEGALGGITRTFVIKYAINEQIPVSETMLSLYDFYTADECFLTGTGAEIVPVIEINNRTVGNGKPGPMTARILKHYRETAETQ